MSDLLVTLMSQSLLTILLKILFWDNSSVFGLLGLMLFISHYVLRIYISSTFPGDIDGTGLGATLRTSGRGNNSEFGRGDTVSLVLDSQTCEILSKFLKCPGLGLLTCKTGGWPGQSLKFPSSSNAFRAEF